MLVFSRGYRQYARDLGARKRACRMTTATHPINKLRGKARRSLLGLTNPMVATKSTAHSAKRNKKGTRDIRVCGLRPGLLRAVWDLSPPKGHRGGLTAQVDLRARSGLTLTTTAEMQSLAGLGALHYRDFSGRPRGGRVSMRGPTGCDDIAYSKGQATSPSRNLSSCHALSAPPYTEAEAGL